MPLLVAEQPGIKVTFNMVPSLLEQVLEYTGTARDPYLNLALKKAEDLDENERIRLLRRCSQGDVFGVTSKIVHFDFQGPHSLLPTPTNYLSLLGLPANTVFVQRRFTSPPTYEPYEP